MFCSHAARDAHPQRVRKQAEKRDREEKDDKMAPKMAWLVKCQLCKHED